MTASSAASDMERGQRRWLLVVFALALLLQLELVFNRPVNWDEFYHLSEAHAFHQGRLTEALQVFYARAFFWLPMLPLDGIDQIRVARLFMLGFELFTLAAIFAMARRFAGALPGALAALAYVTGGYVFQHGFSYRADPMAAAFLMGALWILLESRLDAKAILGAGLLLGLATLTTIKVVLYAPAFAGIAWLRWAEAERSRAMLLRLAAVAAASLLFAALFIGATILSLPEAGEGSAAKTLSTSGLLMFDLFPQWGYAMMAALTAPFLALFVMAAPFGVAGAPVTRSRRLALVGLMLPLASLLFYRNAYPYFYAYILPPVMVAAAFVIAAVAKRFSMQAVSIGLLVNALAVSVATPREVLPAQKQLLAAVHRIFPEPVAYFDFPGMVVDYPKANFFMTNWGYRKYRRGYEDSFIDAMARQTVPLLVLNQDQIAENQTGPEPAWQLLPADAEALRNGFIPHWGPLWVAGRRFPAGDTAQEFIVYTPGIHTVEGGAMRIDGRDLAAGDTIDLARGTHRFERVAAGEVRLRWGDHLTRPDEPFVGGALFKDF